MPEKKIPFSQLITAIQKLYFTISPLNQQMLLITN